MVKQMPTIQAMVAENLGVSLVPSLSVRDLRACRTLTLRPRLFRQIGMLSSATSALVPTVKAWISVTKINLKLRVNAASKALSDDKRIPSQV